MTDEELQAWVKEVSLTAFGLPFQHRAFFNHRLKTTGGRYHLEDHHLDFNPKMLAFGEDVFVGIIKHELCHYHLHLQKKGYRHKDRDFKVLLAQVGGSRFAPEIALGRKYVYVCQKCGSLIVRKRRIDTKRFVCGKCKGKLVFEKIDERAKK